MKNPSPRSHIYRLILLLVIALGVFVVVRWVATPSSWNYDMAHWYRTDALIDNANEPLSYGGNESCQGCHEDEYVDLTSFAHGNLSCESCHGPLIDHIGDGVKVADAIIGESNEDQCLICHAELVSRPKDFPQFSTVSNEMHQDMEEDTRCLWCHFAHDPTP